MTDDSETSGDSTGPSSGDSEQDRMLADITARADELRQTATGVAEQLAQTSGTAKSPDGMVTATVAPTGALQDVQVSSRAAGMQPERLSRSIMTAVQAAQAKASAAMMEAFAPLGGGTDTMNMILDYIPRPDNGQAEADDYDFSDFQEIEEDEDPENSESAPPASAQSPEERPATPRAVTEDVDEEEDYIDLWLDRDST